MIEPLGPFSVSDSGSPKSNQLNAVEDVGLGNIDVAEAGEGAAERNPSNDEPFSCLFPLLYLPNKHLQYYNTLMLDQVSLPYARILKPWHCLVENRISLHYSNIQDSKLH